MATTTGTPAAGRPNPVGAAIKDALSQPLNVDQPPSDWSSHRAVHGFVDFNHVERPHKHGVGVHFAGKARKARAVIEAPEAGRAVIQLAYDDQAVLEVNADEPMDLGAQSSFRSRRIPVDLKKGRNVVQVTLSNTTGANHGGWVFAFKATMPDGTVLHPRPEVQP